MFLVICPAPFATGHVTEFGNRSGSLAIWLLQLQKEGPLFSKSGRISPLRPSLATVPHLYLVHSITSLPGNKFSRSSA